MIDLIIGVLILGVIGGVTAFGLRGDPYPETFIVWSEVNTPKENPCYMAPSYDGETLEFKKMVKVCKGVK